MSKAIQTLTLAESEKFLIETKCHEKGWMQTKKSTRNYCMVLLMLDAGLRAGEVVSMERNDLIFCGEPVKSVVVLGKNSKNGNSRSIPTSDRLRLAIRDMDSYYWKVFEIKPESPAFVGRTKSKPLTVRQLERIVKGIGLAALGKWVNPHMFRHTFATRLMRTCNIRVVQKLLGHKQISSTEVYTHPDMNDLENAIGSINNT